MVTGVALSADWLKGITRWQASITVYNRCLQGAYTDKSKIGQTGGLSHV